MKKEIFCSNCGKKFFPVGREHICPSCKAEAAANAKRAAVERAKARSYSGEACPVRISARARGFIEAVAEQKECKFIPALDEVLKAVCTQYGFTDWNAVPEHKTARRNSKAAKVVTTVTPAAPVAPVAPATPVKAVKASASKTTSKATSKPAETPVKPETPVKATTSKSKARRASKASKDSQGKQGDKRRGGEIV